MCVINDDELGVVHAKEDQDGCTGEKFSLTPLDVRPVGVNQNDKTVMINPPGAYRGRFSKPPHRYG